MTYAYLINQTTISTNPPRRAMIDGRAVAGELPAEYLATLGYYPLDESAPAPSPRDGYHAEPRYTYDDAETPTCIVQSWAEVQDPPPAPRVFSKLKLELKLLDEGLLSAVDAFIDSQTITGASGSTMPMRRAYDTAITFREDNVLFKPTLEAVRTSLGITPEKVEEILVASEAD